MNSAIQEFEQQIESLESYAGVSTRKRVGAYQHDRSCRSLIKRSSNSYRVAQDNVSLKTLYLVKWYDTILESTEPGLDTASAERLTFDRASAVSSTRVSPGVPRAAAATCSIVRLSPSIEMTSLMMLRLLFPS